MPSQPPSSIVVKAVNSTCISVSWKLPPLRTRNGLVRGYKIFYNSTDGMSRVVRLIEGNMTRQLIVSGLRKYTEYSFQLLAFTFGDGPLSSRYVVTTDQDGEFAIVP